MNSTKISFFVLFFLLFVVQSCKLETAKASSQRELIILSDYLQASDTILFRSFSKEKKVTIRIKNMRTEKIIGLIRNEGFAIEGDVIMLERLTDVYKMSKGSLLQRLNFIDDLSSEQQKLSSQLYGFIGYGIDPFIVANTKKRTVQVYNDLLTASFVSQLDEKETVMMLSPIMHKLKKVDANVWIKTFSDSLLPSSVLRDTSKSYPILTLYSDFSSNRDSLLNYSNRFLSYPNSKSTGTFFNLRSIAIVNQAQNYIPAKEFIHYCLEEKNNYRINNYLNTFPIEQTIFRKYTISQEKLVEYNQFVKRLLRKINE